MKLDNQGRNFDVPQPPFPRIYGTVVIVAALSALLLVILAP